jgi:hypothetical protein
MLPLRFAIASPGLAGANATAVAMGSSGPHTGAASALIGILQLGCASLVSGLVAAGQNGTAYSMARAVVDSGVLGGLIWFGFRPIRGEDAGDTGVRSLKSTAPKGVALAPMVWVDVGFRRIPLKNSFCGR